MGASRYFLSLTVWMPCVPRMHFIWILCQSHIFIYLFSVCYWSIFCSGEELHQQTSVLYQVLQIEKYVVSWPSCTICRQEASSLSPDIRASWNPGLRSHTSGPRMSMSDIGSVGWVSYCVALFICAFPPGQCLFPFHFSIKQREQIKPLEAYLMLP